MDDRGRLLRLEQQDRSQWDRSALAEAHDLIVDGLRGGRSGRYVLQAAIASLYAEAPTYDQTDWPQILILYDQLLSVWPSPVVALNRTVAVAHVSGAAQALADIEELEYGGQLAGYHYLPAMKADLAAPVGPHRRGRGRLPTSPGADQERGRAPLPRRAPSQPQRS